jgi:16S rRNA (guanine(966)-N(2))-methyltransferase RsmD
MRVISGIYKHRHFEVPRSFKARPTTDFAKENLFNVLSNYIDFEDQSALDLFSGTGVISLEFLSRGCNHVVSVERDRMHHAFICAVMKEVKTQFCLPLRCDVFKFIKACHETYDIIFADPPYALREIPQLPDLIFEHQLLNADGLFILEHGKDHSFESHPHFIEHREYGSVNFSFFK